MTTLEQDATVARDDRAVDPLGAPVPRRDGHAKTHGAALYAADPRPDELAYAALVHADIARGHIEQIDTTEAAAVPGVIRVITHLDAPRSKRAPVPGISSPARLGASSSVDLLRTDEVFYDGQPVAVVVADSTEAAHEAASRVVVSYREVRPKVDFHAERHDTEPLKAPFLLTVGGRKGDALSALDRAEVIVDREFTTPEYTHNAIEPHSTTAWWDGDLLTVHEGTQALDWVASHLAARFGIPKKNVTVLSPFVGGAFGGKSHVWPGTFLCVLAARVVDRPVQLMLSRAGVYRTVGGRTPSWQRVALGASTDGQLTAIVHQATTRLGNSGGHPEQVTSGTHDAYSAENVLHEQRAVTLDLTPNTFMRAPGESIGTFALESAMDELAYQLGVDPIELRLRNQPDKGPVSGNRFTHHRTPETLRVGAELFGWNGRDPRPGSMRDGDHLVGWGVAQAIHPALLASANLTMTLRSDGTVLVRSSFHEMGMGTATVVAQMTAHLLGIAVDKVEVQYGDSNLPTGPAAGASSQTAAIAASLDKAVSQIAERLRSVARRHAAELGLRSRGIRAEDGFITDGQQRVSYTRVAAAAGPGSDIHVQVGHDTGFRSMAGQGAMVARLMREGRSISRAATGTQFCEVRIDADTGEVRVTRWLGVFDIGTVVNSMTAASQLRGGIVMGIGMSLFEATLRDHRTGRVTNPSLTEYHLPVHADVPHIDIHMLDDPDPSMPLGIVGAGEVGVTGVAAALSNAIHHATGRRLRSLPMTLDQIVG